MDTRQGNKLISQVRADSMSMDSLSFSGLVSIQDQQQSKLPSPPKHYQYQVTKHDSEFEFTNTKSNLNSAVNAIKFTPADQLISNGHLQPQSLAFQTTQSFITKPPGSSRSLLATHISSEMSSGKTSSSPMRYREFGKASKHTNKQSTVTRTGFVHKVKSFLSPCRECKTIKPDAVKAQTVQGENFKIY